MMFKLDLVSVILWLQYALDHALLAALDVLLSE